MAALPIPGVSLTIIQQSTTMGETKGENADQESLYLYILSTIVFGHRSQIISWLYK
jgi:hypothetical protein